MRTPFFILAIEAALIMPRVSSVIGMWTVRKSASAKTPSRERSSTSSAWARAWER
jgi:hypothetical protein